MRKVKWSALLSGVILLCVSAGQARATIWCGHGPGTVLNHPCAASDRPRDPALSQRHSQNIGTQWSNLTGVWKVSPATSAAGGGAEIQVSADPRWAACVRNQIPESVDDIPVLVVPGEVPKVIISNGYFGYLHRPPSRKSNSNLDSEKTYSETRASVWSTMARSARCDRHRAGGVRLRQLQLQGNRDQCAAAVYERASETDPAIGQGRSGESPAQ